MKPILFSTPMVQAILEGTKIQTRRIMKEQPVKNGNFWELGGAGWSTDKVTPVYGHSLYNRIPFQPRTILWVRETWRLTDFLHPSDDNYGYVYKASENGKAWEANDEGWKWKPSIFMPKAACRIFLEVTNVRLERLQDISKTDAIDEGVQRIGSNLEDYPLFQNYLLKGNIATGFLNPIESFQSLWLSINGLKSWISNPWVWVYDFKRIEKP